MKKAKINFFIDILLTISTVLIISIGFLIKYTLLTGKESRAKFGTKLEMSYLGLDRHQWGDIHLYIGFLFIFLLVLHLFFHWDTIKCLFKRYLGTGFITNETAVIFIVIMTYLLFLPFTIEPDIISNNLNHNSENISTNRKSSDTFNFYEYGNKSTSFDEIRGSMTLGELIKNYEINKKEFLKELGVNTEINENTKLGRLRRMYGFDIEKVRSVVENIKNKANRKSVN